ncbi:MAG TPA: dTDP-4-dehydrorhamnose reductase [Nitrospiraceae bacterium]|jgi:dTDP-4-dehydrorhamnose reductase|nr:dTDP-4-dehydrorhamnose reductase [Nitrospiraceae bacterium]
MRILITGADGQLGHELQRVLRRHTLVLGIWPEFDLLKPETHSFIVSARPDVVIHAAAYTDVEGAEREPDLAMAVNGEGTGRVAKAAAEAGARLICISTDYVFDGFKGTPYEETDPPDPLNAYGRSKLEGERQALALRSDAVIVRTSWLYGPQGKNFVKTIMQRAKESSELCVVADQRGSPTHAGDLAAAIDGLLSQRVQGIAHATSAGDCTWHEFACAIVALVGSTVPVRPITTKESRTAVRRPAYSVLANRVLAGVGITLPHWQDALTRFIHDMQAAPVKM